MKIISIRNNIQILALYEKIKFEDPHPNTDRSSILDRALDAVINEKPDLQQINAINMDWVYAGEIKKVTNFFQVKAEESKIEIVTEMIKNSFSGLKVVRMPFLVKLALMYYYFEKIKNWKDSVSQVPPKIKNSSVNTDRIRKAIIELTEFLEETEEQYMTETKTILLKLKESTVNEIVNYDFKEQIVKFKDSDDEIDRFAVYQAIGIVQEGEKKTKDKDGFAKAKHIYDDYKKSLDDDSEFSKEADNCNLIKKIYEELWGEDIKNEMCGDTMNSCNTTFKKLLKKEFKATSWSKRKTVFQYIDNKDKLIKTVDKYKGAREFLKEAYTLGNFIPCPSGCNSPRGYQNSKIEDYWDLTLYYIYQWYGTKNDEFIGFIVNKNIETKYKERLKKYKTWLEKFRCWDIFVEKNYMQDFVNYDSETRKYGMPKELWKGHFDSAKQGKVFPIKNNEKNEFAQFFTNASAWITARGTRMAIELKNKLDREDISEIVKKLLKNDEG